MSRWSRKYNTAIMAFPAIVLAAFSLSGGGDAASSGFLLGSAMPQWIPGFDSAAFWIFFCGLLAIVNPVAAIPLFLTSTSESSASERNKLAFLTATAVLVAAIVAAVFGKHLLGFFSIGVDSLRIAGGIIVLTMGFQLLQSEMSSASGSGDAGGCAVSRRSKIVCPLAIPFLFGPGAITTVIIQCEAVSSASGGLVVAAAIAVISVLVFLTLIAAQPIARWLGDSGMTVVARIGGMIIAAIAVDMMITGVRNSFPGIA